MVHEQWRAVLQVLRRIAVPNRAAELSDGELLRQFIDQRDEAAFAALLQRHGRLVFGVCQRILHNLHDAEDAFQATFLVLVRKARSIVKQESVACWLHGVAHHTARRAKGESMRRQARERQNPARPAGAELDDLMWRDLRGLIDEEVLRLPGHCRSAFVLCYLEGKTNAEAARLLGCPKGTVQSRLAHARELLRARLTRRGLTLSAAVATTMLAQSATTAAVPEALTATTVKSAVLLATGQAAGGVISAKVIALMEGVVQAMLLTKIRFAAVILLVLGLAGTGAGLLTYRGWADQPGDVPQQAVQNVPQQAEQPPPVPKAALRYAGKSFGDWQLELQTELKAELRVEGLKAMAAFGAHGHEKEAAAAVLITIRDYDVDKAEKENDQPDRQVISQAEETLKKIGPAALPILLGTLKDRNLNGRRFAARVLQNVTSYGKAAGPAPLEAATDSDSYVRVRAILALSNVPPTEGAVLALTTALKDHDVDIRRIAASGLGQFGPKAKTAAPALVAATRDSDRGPRFSAVNSLAKVGAEPSLVVPAFVQVLKDKDKGVRELAVQLLGSLGPDAKDAVPALSEMFKIGDSSLRLLVAKTLGNIGPAAKEAIPLLTSALQDENTRVRGAVSEALKQIAK